MARVDWTSTTPRGAVAEQAVAVEAIVVPMTSLGDRIGELRLGDLSTFLAVRRAGSITGAARELRVTPSQVSKAITRLESALRVQLLSRSSRGVALSETGRRVLPHVETAVARLLLIGRAEAEALPELTVAAPSYLLGQFLPTIASSQPQLRVRGLELPPALVRAYAAENFFDSLPFALGDGAAPQRLGQRLRRQPSQGAVRLSRAGAEARASAHRRRAAARRSPSSARFTTPTASSCPSRTTAR